MSLRVTDDGVVRTFTFDDPDTRNSLDADTVVQLRDALRAAADDDAVRVVVLTGAGGDFSSGANLSRPGRDRHPVARMRQWTEIVTALQDLPQPTIARVRGVAVGAAANLVLGCDLVVADPSVRFCEIFARRGLSPDAGGSWLLPRAVGLLQARRLALLGDMVEADEARELGLVTFLVSPADLDAKVASLAERLAAGPPVALAQTRRLLNRAWSSPLEEALELEAAMQAVNFATDAPEAKRAFAAREEPRFEGRWQVESPAPRSAP
ncbi:enoyl-CoA hydratase/isomerase family protein [Amycolatopsis echigonensis]|uniref:Enoyl-CoA hydratase/isomerase family protein n=1 Tax=Amycolatopsis echigonensis TaxID=2576905 RepID=A0A8E2B2F2_9PSEU|nr:enoyl-CoA hydratase-related protein [Amycolatopsis echigonensis]MBB2500519.1 enoyl-CoA hydratase/isomerase family protein [Amycolatopsis echigonensis]